MEDPRTNRSDSVLRRHGRWAAPLVAAPLLFLGGSAALSAMTRQDVLGARQALAVLGVTAAVLGGTITLLVLALVKGSRTFREHRRHRPVERGRTTVGEQPRASAMARAQPGAPRRQQPPPADPGRWPLAHLRLLHHDGRLPGASGLGTGLPVRSVTAVAPHRQPRTVRRRDDPLPDAWRARAARAPRRGAAGDLPLTSFSSRSSRLLQWQAAQQTVPSIVSRDSSDLLNRAPSLLPWAAPAGGIDPVRFHGRGSQPQRGAGVTIAGWK